METINPLYQHNIGQRTGLSYLDAKAINIAYCSGREILINNQALKSIRSDIKHRRDLKHYYVGKISITHSIHKQYDMYGVECTKQVLQIHVS